MKKRWILISLTLLSFVLITMYKAPAQTKTPTGRETLKIGLIAPLSGPALPWGEAVLLPAEIAAEEINAQGGLKVGSKVYEIKLIPYDDKYTGEGGLTAATRFIYEDKGKFILGPISSASLLAMQSITEKEKVIVFGNTYTTKALSPDKPFTFRYFPTSAEFSGPQVAWVSKKYPNLKTVVICSPNDETGREVAAHNTDAYEKAGIKVLSVEYYERGMPDMAPLITRVLRMKPDGLESDGSAPGDAANLYKTARALGYKGMFLRTGGEATEAILSAARQAVEGMIYHADSDIEGATGKLADFFTKLRKKRAGPISSASPYSYNSLMMLCLAIQKAGTVEDTGAVRVAMEQIKEFDALWGKVRWTGKDVYGIDHQLTGPTYIGQIIEGKAKIIAKIE